MKFADHEKSVTEFFSRTERDDPQIYAAVCARHLVLDEKELRYRRSWEVSLEAIMESGGTE